MIILIGIGHVFQIHERLKEEIRRAKPGVVCLELDRARWDALLEQRRREREGLPPERGFDWRMIGRGAIIFALLALMQERLAHAYGSNAGHEMIAAHEAAREVGARTELIDKDSTQFLGEWIGGLSMGERVRVMFSVLVGLLASPKRVEKELDQFYGDEDAFLREMGNEFPGTKKALLDDRNEHLARGIGKAQLTAPIVVAVVGEGHVAGIREHLLKAGQPEGEIRTISLRELQDPAGKPTDAGQEPQSNAEFQLTYRAAPDPAETPPPPPSGPPARRP